MTDPQYTPPPSTPYAPSGGVPTQKKTLSTISLIAGIVGVVGSFVPIVSLLALPAAIAAIVLGFLGRSRERHARGFWLTGIILGFVTIAILLIAVIIGIVLVASNPSQFGVTTG